MPAANFLNDWFKMRASLLLTMMVVTGTATPGAIALEDPPPPTAAESAERDFVEAVGGGFRFARSEHFVLAYDIDEEFARALLREMELTHRRVRHFCERYELPHKPLARRLQAFCSDDPEDFSRLGFPRGEFSLGVYDPKTRRTYFDLSTLFGAPHAGPDGVTKDAMMQPRAEAIEITVRHESAHQLLAHFCPTMSEHMPEWLAEGLACAFEPRLRREPDVYMRLNDHRMFDTLPFGRREGFARMHGREPRHVGQFLGDAVNILRRGSFPDLTGLGDSEAGEEAARWYGISWALVFVLQHEHPEAFKALLHTANVSKVPRVPVNVRAILERKGVTIDSAFEDRYQRLVSKEEIRLLHERRIEARSEAADSPDPRP